MNAPPPPRPPAQDASSPSGSGAQASRLFTRVRGPVTRVLTLSWVPLTASLLSLVLSIGAFIASTQQPEVMVILPDQIRIAQGRSSGSAFVYLQPAFVSTGQSERVEVIRDITLTVQRSSREPARFRWDEQVKLVDDAGAGQLSYQYVGDAVPILVSPRSASAALYLFDAPDGWFFEAGTYTFTLVGERVVGSEPVRASFDVTLTAENIAFLDAPGPEQFLAFPLR